MRISFYITLFLLGCNYTVGYSQGRSNYWPLGYSSFGNPLNGGFTVDFPNNTFNYSNHPREMWFDFTNAAISNDTGALQFYTNGFYIANALDDTLLNGININPSIYTTQFNKYGLRLPQGDIIIPKPGSDSLYYLFHETIDILPSGWPKYLYQSVIDMSLDSSKGAVVEKNKVLIDDTLIIGALTMCKHANGRDWWLLVPEMNTKLGYYTLLVKPDTIEMYSHAYYPIDSTQIGQACFSPDGSKYIITYWSGAAFFNFDRCSGTLTLIDTITVDSNSFCAGASISPNSRYAYLSLNADRILQYDLQASNIKSSNTVVAVYDNFQAPAGWSTTFWMHQLAPDNNIYISTTGSTFAFHVIDQPDSAGLACNVIQHGVIFPKFNNTIPNFPNYDLGRLQGSACDTLLWTGSPPAPEGGEMSLRVNPNPASNYFYINYDIPTNKNLLFVLYDSFGKEVLRKTLYGTTKHLLINTSGLSDGVYYGVASSETSEGIVQESVKVVVIKE